MIRNPFRRKLMADDVIYAAERKRAEDQVEQGIKPVRGGLLPLSVLVLTIGFLVTGIYFHHWLAAAVNGANVLIQCFLLANLIRATQRHAYLLGVRDGLDNLRRQLEED